MGKRKDVHILELIIENKGNWLTARELFLLLLDKSQHIAISNHISLAQVLKKYRLPKRRRFFSKETEYLCDLTRRLPSEKELYSKY